ncbi:MAG: hotdog fold thioesterase [Nesterenkonia sp.]|uniref:hotdog fold thioesterase n=1 Tax=Nesterenkonia marinintestina TaxID=2979865 RepID=UPI0021BECC99|nr:hotdog fold thioesterase [Nesterenkonia sp. GX14115]MDO5492323.1 hotdog fold thioesterase [Nesterenkonia sp.]
MVEDFIARSRPSAPTPHPAPEEREALLRAAGVPEEHWEHTGPYGIAPLSVRMGMRYLEFSPERVVATMPVSGNEQNVGLLHGGAHLVMAESLGSLAAVLHVRTTLGLDRAVVGTEIGATHHRAITEGLVTATCTPITLGRTLTCHEVVMRDEQDRRLSTARMTNMILADRG